MAANFRRHVFLSYVREDSKRVYRLKRGLERRGVFVWLDREQIAPGSRWKAEIKRAISEGACFVACFSEHYVSRDATYMNEELRLAVEQLRLRPNYRPWFIPALLSKCEIPDVEIGNGETLRSLQCVSLYQNEGEGIRKILKTLEDIGMPVRDEVDEWCVEDVKAVFGIMGFLWHRAPSRAFSGVVQISGKHRFTGLHMLVIVKDFHHHGMDVREENYLVKLSDDEVRAISRAHAPVLLICFGTHPAKPKYAVVKKKYHDNPPEVVRIRRNATFGPHTAKEIYYVAREWYGRRRTYPVLGTTGSPILRVASVKRDARQFYDHWRKDGCESPYFGRVLITLRAWRHLTARKRTQADVIHRLQLLQAARAVLETLDKAEVVRTEEGRIFYSQKALMRCAHRTDALVSVITERFRRGPVRFYGVYEHLE